MSRSLYAAAGFLLGAAVLAPCAPAVAADPAAAVKPGTYKVEPFHTQIGFSLSHFGLSPFSGFLSGASGSLTLDPKHPAASKLEVSVKTETVLTTVDKLNEELRGAAWLDAGKFPEASFVSTKVTQTGQDSATIAGTLTLHGVTKPLVLKAHFAGVGVNPVDKAYTIGFVATGTIKRTEFGVSTYAPAIGDDVTLTINGAFEKQD